MDGAVFVRAAVCMDCLLVHVSVGRLRAAAIAHPGSAGHRSRRTTAVDREQERNVAADLQRRPLPDHGSTSCDVRVGRPVRIRFKVRLVCAERYNEPFGLDSGREMLPAAPRGWCRAKYLLSSSPGKYRAKIRQY